MHRLLAVAILGCAGLVPSLASAGGIDYSAAPQVPALLQRG